MAGLLLGLLLSNCRFVVRPNDGTAASAARSWAVTRRRWRRRAVFGREGLADGLNAEEFVGRGAERARARRGARRRALAIHDRPCAPFLPAPPAPLPPPSIFPKRLSVESA